MTGIMPVTRGNLPEPSVPDECPQDVLYLIHACTAADPGLRPTAKEVCSTDRTLSCGRCPVFGRSQQFGCDSLCAG